MRVGLLRWMRRWAIDWTVAVRIPARFKRIVSLALRQVVESIDAHIRWVQGT
jgi:hypothetical protein